MAISEKSIKMLWGLAAGRCSKPGCQVDCIPFLSLDSPTVVGEMAHIISQSPNGPRGEGIGGSDEYENLILLCPTHHSMIDKAPEGTFPASDLYDWKLNHEERVRRSILAPHFTNRREMALAIKRLLIANEVTWHTYGPDSDEAYANPLSGLHTIWPFRKLASIVPKNRQISEIIVMNEDLFEADDLGICYKFVEHAAGFERNCYDTIEGVPRFPVKFQDLIDAYTKTE